MRWRGKPMHREPLGVTVRRNRETMLSLISDPEQRARYLAENPEDKLPALPQKRRPKPDLSGVDIDAIHRKQPPSPEAAVVAAVSELLATHPRVAVALRMNSGMASYNAANGNAYQPVWFHKFLRYPEPLKMPDFLGWLTDGRTFALEAKRGNWKQPSDDRERKQAAFLAFIRSTGGIGKFVTSVEQANDALR